ncbi:MAG: class I mannose-6-phosphate isomerase [Bacteroidales bacterium]|nr:class I mannose-6-phosphate isomerase [Bacteroidales bacterium]
MDILRFKPILKTVVWGGEKIAPYKGIETQQTHIGESWELSGVKGNESVIDGGDLDGKTIADVFPGEFPLLIKFIDAAGDLSIQVHPNDALAAVRHNGSKGKTEMWYVVDAEPGAYLYAGLKEEIGPEEYSRRVADGSIVDVLARHDVHKGDVFFLPAGRIHAICKGCFIAEIQETSDITYRIWDYNRPGLDGKPRQLHTELAKDAIDYKVYPDYRTEYTPKKDEEVVLVSCEHFTTSLYELTKPFTRNVPGEFLVVMCIDGSGKVDDVPVRRGQTVLVPASRKTVTFTPADGMKLITSWV